MLHMTIMYFIIIMTIYYFLVYTFLFQKLGYPNVIDHYFCSDIIAQWMHIRDILNIIAYKLNTQKGNTWCNISWINHNKMYIIAYNSMSFRRGRDIMIVECITTYAISEIIIIKVVSSNPIHGEVYSIQHNVITIVSNLRQIAGFLRILRFPPKIKLTTTI